MKFLLALTAAVTLFAATPEEAIAPLEADGYFIEAGSSASEEVVSDAVFEGRAAGGRLYLVVLAEEPPGGATTFSDSVLDRLGDGYVVTVAPETVGFAGDGSFWSADEMNEAVDASLGGGSDDEVVALFARTLTGEPVGGNDVETPASGGGISILWILLIGGAAVVIWIFFSRRNQGKASAERLDEVRRVAKTKLDEVANDILEMEDEVAVSDNNEAKMHFQRASKMYAQAIEDVESATTAAAMLEVSEELDLAIWELDCAEAVLDGKPKPAKPEPPRPEPVPPPPVPEGHSGPSDSNQPPPPPPPNDFDRRPQRQSTGSGDVMEMLLAMMAMGGMRGGGFGGGFGGFRSGPGRSMGGGGRRSMGGGGGRIRGGGRRG